MKSLDPTFTAAHKIAIAVSMLAVSLILTGLCSLIAVAGGWVVRRVKRTAEQPDLPL